ncbi:hypothetical protein LSAT2_009700 [Lamellibrachia satsuma]|nr:hypothetical protein LSAT2_009700 [Lamellibrachia satsuma]
MVCRQDASTRSTGKISQQGTPARTFNKVRLHDPSTRSAGKSVSMIRLQDPSTKSTCKTLQYGLPARCINKVHGQDQSARSTTFVLTPIDLLGVAFLGTVFRCRLRQESGTATLTEMHECTIVSFAKRRLHVNGSLRQRASCDGSPFRREYNVMRVATLTYPLAVCEAVQLSNGRPVLTTDVAGLLIKAGCDVNAIDVDGATTICLAYNHGLVDICRRMLNADTKPDAGDSGFPPDVCRYTQAY